MDNHSFVLFRSLAMMDLSKNEHEQAMEEFESLAEDCSQWYNLLHLESKHVCMIMISALIGLDLPA